MCEICNKEEYIRICLKCKRKICNNCSVIMDDDDFMQDFICVECDRIINFIPVKYC